MHTTFYQAKIRSGDNRKV